MDALIYLIPVLGLLYAIIFYLLWKINKEAVEAFIRDKNYVLSQILPILTAMSQAFCLQDPSGDLCRYSKNLHDILQDWYNVNQSLIGSTTGEVIETFKD